MTTISNPRINKFDVKQVRVKNIYDATKIIDVASFGSRFIFTFMEKQEDGTIDFKRTHSIVNFWLNWNKEKFRWGISCAEISNFLRGRKTISLIRAN